MFGYNRRAAAVPREATAAPGTGSLLPSAIGAMLARFFAAFNLWFWAIVGVPTLLAGVYYFGIASDLYVSEAKFVVHGPAKIAPSGLSSLLGGATMSADNDTGIVQEYILSRDAAEALDAQVDLRAVLSRPGADFLTRFPGILFFRRDFERLYTTYENFVSIQIPSEGGVATLRVKAYRPEDAKRIAQVLMADSEKLINDLNERARNDALATFDREVQESQRHLDKIQDELTTYRVKANMLDPKAEATGPLTLLAKLNQEEAGVQGQLSDVLKNSPRSPQIALLKNRIASLDKLIAEARTKITGGGGSVATAMNEYERLSLQSQMEEKIVAQAVGSREQARLNAQRQQLYLETIARPNLPDYPILPNRVSSFATVVGSCLLAYGIAWLLIGGVREHASA